MSTITSERLLNIQQWRETYGPGSNVVLPAEEAEELARIALAAQASRTVYQWRERYEEGHFWDDCTKEQYEGFAKRPDVETRILYTAPPAPETADREMLKRLAVILSGSDAPGEIRSLTVTAQSFVERCKALAKERDACHAVMLKSEVNGSPSLMAMMRALDAFYADEDVPERAMLAALRILIADIRGQGVLPVAVPDERTAFNEWNNDIDCPLAGRDATTAAWLGWSRRAAQQPSSGALQLPELSDAQCLEFLSLAFRHASISGDVEFDDIRLGLKMALAAPQKEAK